MSTMHTLLPASIFKHLEPYPGGNWTISAETADTVTASYSCGNNSEVVSYTLHRCRTELDVMAQCQSLMYNFESGDEELAAENSSDAKETITELAVSTIDLKIEQVDNAAWPSLAMPTAENCFDFYPSQANNAFSAPAQGSHDVQQSTSEYTFSAPSSVDCQQQIPFTYNDSFVPINNYWPVQAEFQNVNGEFATSDEYRTSGEHQWFQ